jgi:PHD-finger
MTDMDLDEEPVALVRLPPSPTIEPSTPSNLSTLSSLSTSISDNENTTISKPPIRDPANERVSVAIPTPKSTTSDTSPPPNSSKHGPSPSTTHQVQDNCMFCTPETAPPGENLEWIQCNGCKRWSHTLCTGLPLSIDISAIDKFHCKRCEKTRGPTTCTSFPYPTLSIVRPPPRKSERSHVNIDYTSLNLGDTTNILPDQHAYNAFFEGDSPRKFAPDRFERMKGDELTREWAERTGCKEPVVIPRGCSDGMEMVMPTDLTVRKVAEMVGEDQKVEVIGIVI